ncbi:MAG: hypothetical protein HDS12_05025 [Bacteroides sp.]|nr:hypothetical protein [Bacteroides sp.]
MKKTIIGLATLAITLLPSVGFAQTQTTKTTDKVEQVSKQGKASKKLDKRERGVANKDVRSLKKRIGERNGCDSNCKAAYNDSVNFESLNLNDTQKEKIKSLNEARRVSVRGLKERARAQRAQNDTLAVMEGNQIELVQSKYLKDLREVLTADQYVQFLENNYVKGGNKGPKGPDMKMVKKGNRPQSGAPRSIKPAKNGVATR